jgi:hypothetical protein
MDSDEIQKKCSDFLAQLGIPGFIVFGWEKPDKQFGFVYSHRQMPPTVAVKGMTWALHDFANKKL